MDLGSPGKYPPGITDLQSEPYVHGVYSHWQNVGRPDAVNEVNNPGQWRHAELRLQAFYNEWEMLALRRLRSWWEKLPCRLTDVKTKLCYRRVWLTTVAIRRYVTAAWKNRRTQWKQNFITCLSNIYTISQFQNRSQKYRSSRSSSDFAICTYINSAVM